MISKPKHNAKSLNTLHLLFIAFGVISAAGVATLLRDIIFTNQERDTTEIVTNNWLLMPRYLVATIYSIYSIYIYRNRTRSIKYLIHAAWGFSAWDIIYQFFIETQGDEQGISVSLLPLAWAAIVTFIVRRHIQTTS